MFVHPSHFRDEKDTGSHDQNENTIALENNTENHSSHECDCEESSEEKVQVMIGLLKKKTLGNHTALQPDTGKDNRLHNQGQYECLCTWLYFNHVLRGYMCKICEMYYGSKPCSPGRN